MPRNKGIGRTGKKHKKSADDNIHRQPKATTEPTLSTEVPEPPAAPDNSPEMEVEPAAPDQNRLLLMTAEHEAAVTALRLTLAAEQSDTASAAPVRAGGHGSWTSAGRRTRPQRSGAAQGATTFAAARSCGEMRGSRRTHPAGRTRAGFGASTTSFSCKRPRWSTSGAGWPAAGKNLGFSWRISGPL